MTYFLFNEHQPFRQLAAEQNALNLDTRAIARRGATTEVMNERADSEAVCQRAVSRRL